MVAGPSTKVYGIDISEGMLWQGVEYLRREGVGNVGFARAQVEALPFRHALPFVQRCFPGRPQQHDARAVHEHIDSVKGLEGLPDSPFGLLNKTDVRLDDQCLTTFLDDFGGYLFQSWPASCYKGRRGTRGLQAPLPWLRRYRSWVFVSVTRRVISTDMA